MKWMPKVFYIFFLFIITTFFYNGSIRKQYQAFYLNEAESALKENDLERYFDVFFTATKITDKYNTVPLYEAEVEELYNFYILQTLTNETVVNWFYFNDFIEDYSVYLKDEEKDFITMNFTRLMYEIKVFMDDDIFPITNNFPINPNEKTLKQPLPLMQFHTNEQNELVYYYSSNNEEGKVKYKESVNISKIEINFVLDNASLDSPIIKNIININHNELGSNNLDELSLVGNAYLSNNFNGDINTHDSREQFNKNLSNIKIIDQSIVSPYINERTKYMIKYFSVVFVITYLIFFLTPSIKYVKRKFQEKNSK